MGHDDAAAQAPASRRPPGGPAKGDKRRQAIVDAVEELLKTKTIADLSVEIIAAEAGISRSGFYFYFESKYAALADALDTFNAKLIEAGGAFYTGEGDPADFFHGVLLEVFDLWRAHGDLMVAIVDGTHSDPGLRAMWDAWIDSLVAGIAARIEEGRANGTIEPGPPDAPHLARTLLTMNFSTFTDLCRRRELDGERELTIRALSHTWLRTLWGTRANA